jgi:hypothetical protein
MITKRERFCILSDRWGRLRSIALMSPIEPDVGMGDDGFLWLDIGVDGTPEMPVWKMWDEPQKTWRTVAGGGHVIQDEGSDLPQRGYLNFVGGGVTVTDSGNATVVQIPGTSAVVPAIATTVSPAPDGNTTVFTLDSGSYVGNTTLVFLNGQLLTRNDDYTESDPENGAITFAVAPRTGDIIRVVCCKQLGFVKVNQVVTPEPDGVTTTFYTPSGYESGTLIVTLNGLVQTPGEDFTETSPSNGSFTFAYAPPSGSVIRAHYNLASGGAGHDPVTLSASADAILSLNDQELGLDVQSAHTVLAGPTSGSAAPTFRTLEAGDLGGIIDTDVTLSSNSDSKVPSQRATKAYVDNAIATRAPSEHKHSSLAASDGSPDPALSVDADGNVSVVSNIAIPGTLTVGTDVHIFRGTVNRLDLAGGDSLNLVSGNLQVAGVTAIDSSRNASFASSVTLGGDVQLTRGAADRLDLASGDSLNIISGALQIAGTTAIDSGRGGSLTGLTVSGGINVGSATGAGTGHVRMSGEIYARGDNRGLAARVYEPYTAAITDHFRSGSIPSGYSWTTLADHGGTPPSVNYGVADDYMGVSGAGSTSYLLGKYGPTSLEACQDKYFAVRVLPGDVAAGVTILYNCSGTWRYVTCKVGRASDYTITYQLQHNLGGSVVSVTTNYFWDTTQPVIIRLYHHTDNYVYSYVVNEAGWTQNLARTSVTVPTISQSFWGMGFYGSGTWAFVDWFWTDI